MPHNDREQNFEKALARNLQSSFASSNPSAPDSNCLDAEILAAYHDRLLDPEEMSARKSHIASCPRCQEILVQLEATDEIRVEADRELLLDAGAMSLDLAEPQSPPQPAELVAASASAPESSSAPSAAPQRLPITITTLKPAPSLHRPKMVRYVALAGALAAALLFWVAFRERAPESFELAKNQPQRSVPDSQPQPSSNPSAPSSSPAPADSIAQPAQESESPRAGAPNTPPPPKSRVAAETADALTGAVSPSANSTLRKQVLDKKDASPSPSLNPSVPTNPKSSAAGSSVAAPSGAIEAAAADLAAKRPSNDSNNLSADLKRQLDLRSASPKSKEAAPPPHSDRNQLVPSTPPPVAARIIPSLSTDSAAESAKFEPQQSVSAVANVSTSEAAKSPIANRAFSSLAPLSVPAPGGTTLWRVGRAGLVQRSSDSGATWSIQPSGIVADLLAGSAYSDQICWLVGRNGTILRTTDGGATWQKITAPTTLDLVSVFAINADSATITDAASRAYQTTSAGSRWSRTLSNQP
jgi:Photosynthesis system II assembly factor YCF48